MNIKKNKTKKPSIKKNPKKKSGGKNKKSSIKKESKKKSSKKTSIKKESKNKNKIGISCTLTKTSRIISILYENNIWKPILIKLFTKILGIVNIDYNTIVSIISSKEYDEIIFNKLSKVKYTPIIVYNEQSDIKKAYSKWNNLKGHLTKRIGSIMDMGGNVGNTAMVLGRRIFNLPKEKTLVVDINEWAGIKWKPRDDITFFHYDNMKKIPSNSIDLITVFHTLHHIPYSDYDNIMSEFYRILSPDGDIVLYEHNCKDDKWAYIFDIEHALFDVIVNKSTTYSNFVKKSYAKYLSIEKWIEIFNKAGFKEYYRNELENADNSFYSFFQKAEMEYKKNISM